MKKLNSYIYHFLSKYRIYFLSLIVIAISAGILEVSVDYKIKEIIDEIASKQTSSLGLLLALFVIYKLAFHGVYFLSRMVDIKYRPAMIEQTIVDSYKKTVKHSLHWFDSHLSGEISGKISDFQAGITDLISPLFKAFNIVVTILISLFFLSHIHLSTAFVLIGFILIYTPVIYWLLTQQMKLQESCIHARQKTVGMINDSITNVFGIKVIGNVLTEFRRNLKPSIRLWKSWEKRTRQFDAYYVDNADTVMVTAMSAIQIYLLAYLYQHGEITAGGFAFIAMITLKIHDQLGNFLESLLFNINPRLAQVRASYSFIHQKIDVEDKDHAEVLRKVKGEIEYREVTFAYGRRKPPVLSRFSLKIYPKERIGIVGPSGAGKTTMMKCLLRYFDVSSGSIFIDGYDLKSVTQESLRKAISIIPQDISMFHRSIKENLKLAKSDASDEDIIFACKKAKIHDDIQRMPHGYDTVVGEKGVKLSGGQRQRIAIARAILKNAPILILDEATSSLDSPTEQLIQQSIHEILEKSQSTVIAIAHRLSTLKHMDKIVVLDQGKIVEVGTHRELIGKKSGLYRKLWEMQAI